jgi:hypothetical protein
MEVFVLACFADARSVSLSVCVCACVCVCVCVCVCARVRVHACMHARTLECTWLRECGHVCARVCF